MLPVAVKDATSPSMEPSTVPVPVAAAKLFVPPTISYVPVSSNGASLPVGPPSQTVPTIDSSSAPFPFLLFDVGVKVASPAVIGAQNPVSGLPLNWDQSAVSEDVNVMPPTWSASPAPTNVVVHCPPN